MKPAACRRRAMASRAGPAARPVPPLRRVLPGLRRTATRCRLGAVGAFAPAAAPDALRFGAGLTAPPALFVPCDAGAVAVASAAGAGTGAGAPAQPSLRRPFAQARSDGPIPLAFAGLRGFVCGAAVPPPLPPGGCGAASAGSGSVQHKRTLVSHGTLHAAAPRRDAQRPQRPSARAASTSSTARAYQSARYRTRGPRKCRQTCS